MMDLCSMYVGFLFGSFGAYLPAGFSPLSTKTVPCSSETASSRSSLLATRATPTDFQPAAAMQPQRSASDRESRWWMIRSDETRARPKRKQNSPTNLSLQSYAIVLRRRSAVLRRRVNWVEPRKTHCVCDWMHFWKEIREEIRGNRDTDISTDSAWIARKQKILWGPE